jgi:ketosteroid isomerase-like protein
MQIAFAPRELLLAYLDAYARMDIAAISAMLAPEVRLQDWNIAVEGAAAVIAETQKNFAQSQSIDIQVKHIYVNEDRAAAELHIVVNGTIELDVVDALQFNQSGLITSVRAYKG